ncbi:FecR family protein [Flagellimonas sp.]|uniref:FecR family protein n=1 Tax=Flagellimonas sp. TaxID=2058762 RepID=UPI003F4A24FC
MKNRDIRIIIHKFLNHSATEKEIGLLVDWAKENRLAFRQEVELHHVITGAMKKEKAEHLKEELLKNFHQVNAVKIRRGKNRLFKYAAIFVGLITFGMYSYYTFIDSKTTIPTQEVTITLEDGSTREALNEENSGIVSKSNTYIVEQKGTKISYKKLASNQNSEDPLIYNTLEVPYGKKFQVTLSDGTDIYLNSGSSLTYPVVFKDRGPRNVALRGEAYFTVTSDSLRPFSVSTGHLEANVLGTEFNVSNYADDSHVKIVLVEGSLSVDQRDVSDGKAVLMKPNQLVSYSNSNKKLFLENVDISSYVAWKEGVLLFKNEDFQNIIKKLERHYDVRIELKDLGVGKETYTGRFKTETIEEVLGAFQRIKHFDFTITKEKITITLKNKPMN